MVGFLLDIAMTRKQRESHGGYGTRLYTIWRNMRARCNNLRHINYVDYGLRGITVCREWNESFAAFRSWAMTSGYSDDLTIDRRNNDGNYTPGNCKWSTRKEQQGNTRKRSDGVTSRYRGVSMDRHGRFVLQIKGRPSGKVYCGMFATEEEAAREYDRIVSKEIPSRIYRNFPVEGE